MVYDGSAAAAAAVIGAGTCYVPPKEHRSRGALLIFFCFRIVLQKMYEVLLRRSTGPKEHFKRRLKV